ncbi:MAG: tetratricopeptide repeat protein [Phycisphaerales bacterium]|nr:tetratricopeptide repeat protein [Phycisphaerales bacterium]
MAKKALNKKLVMLVGGFLLFAALVLGGGAYFTITRAPERNLRLGDEGLKAAAAAEKAGDENAAYTAYQEALGRFGRAVNKKPNNLEYNQRMVDTLALMTPKTSGDAQELYSKRERLLRKRTQAAPLDGKQWLMYLDASESRAQLFEDAGLWRDIVDVCTEGLVKLPPDEPNVPAVQAMQIRAQLAQDAILTVDERAVAEQSAREYLAKHPGAIEVWAALLRSVHSDATRLAFANRIAESQGRTMAFDADMAKATALFPKDPSIQVVLLARLISRAFANDPMVTNAAIDEVLAPLLWKGGDQTSTEPGLIANAEPAAMLELARLVSVSTNKGYAGQLVTILDGYTKANPNDLLHLGALAQTQRDAGQRTESRATLEQLIAVPRLKVSMLSAFQDDIRVTAAERLFDTDFTDWEIAPDPSQKATAFASMKASRARLAELAAGREGEISLIRADAKIAFAAGDYLIAVTRLEEVFARADKPTAELFILSAICLIERGELGAALVKLDRGISDFPAAPQFYLTRARVLMQLGRLTEARRALIAVLERYPGLEDATKLMAELDKVPGEGTVNIGDMVVKILGDAELVAREGKVEEATRMLENALVTYPKDVRIQRTIIQWLLFVGSMDTARLRLAEFMADHPDDTVFKQLQVLATKDSPLERAVAFVDLINLSPPQRAVEVLVATINLRDNLAQRLAIVAPAQAGFIKTELAKTEAAVADAKAKAIELAPGDTFVLDRLLTDALKAKDASAVDQVIALAEQSAVDRTLVPLLRGRVALDREDWASAIKQFELAQSQPGASAPGFRLLGVAKERSGDIAGAREAYRIAHERRPNDLASVQLYAGLLARSGDMSASRDVLRTAMLAMPESPELRNVYLEIEGQFGSRADSMVERRRLYAVRPSDVDNARQLLRILVEAQAAREFLINNDGSERFSAADWEALTGERREQELDALTQIHKMEAQAIFDQLMKMDGDKRPSIRGYGASMQRAGRGREAEVTLQALAEKALPASAWQAWIDLAELQAQDGRPVAAEASFVKAIGFDTTGKGLAAQATAAYWVDHRRPLLARRVLEPAFAANPSLAIARQLAAVQLDLRDFEAAKKSIAEVERLSQGPPTFSDRLLSADIANAEIESTFTVMSPAQTKVAIAAFDTAIDAAIKADQSSPVPFIVRAGALQRRFQRTGETEILSEARRDIERAFELQANFWPATRLRASICMDEGDMLSAIQVVRRFVEQNPRNVDARRALVGYYISAADFSGAVDAVKAIMVIEPNNPVWIDALAEAYTAAQQFKEAGDAYEKLFEVSGDLSMLTKSVLMRIKSVPPDFTGILNSLRNAKQDTSTIPFLQMAGAAAIAGAGENEVQRNQGIIQLREMYKTAATNAVLVDAWTVAAGSLYSTDRSAEFEKFVLLAASNTMTSTLARNLASRFVTGGPDDMAKALDYGTKSVELATNDDDRFFALSVLGGIQYAAKDYTSAMATFELALAIHPEDAMTINNIAFLEALDPSKTAHAVERARIALARDPANVDLMDTLGFALLKSGALPESINHLTRASRMRPSPAVYAHLAAAQLKAGRRNEAEGSVRRAKLLRPDAEAQRDLDEVERAIAESNSGG